jgi:hypothetical protein
MLTVSHDGIIHENTKVPEFYQVPPKVMLGYFSEIADFFFSIHLFIAGESNGKLPLRTCPGCSIPEPYRSPDWALVPAQTSPKG